MPRNRLQHLALSLSLPVALAGCAMQRPPEHVPSSAPMNWQAPLPHGGSVSELESWWRGAGDALLAELIHEAQLLSPSVAQARSTFEQARATQTAARAALLPSLDAQANASRGFSEQNAGIANTAQIGLQAGWEIDLFGRNAATSDAARSRVEGAHARWHDARVSVAAEVALQYTGWRYCVRLVGVLRDDTASREQTARLSRESERAGFTAPANAALAAASFSDGRVRAAQQQLQCDIGIKTLVALTGRDEPALRAALAQSPAMPLPENLFTVDSIPAQTLAQRPDVYAAEREVAAASAEVGSAEADRYPRLTLGGSIGRMYLGASNVSGSSNVWSIGPLAVSLPLFDGGRRAAEVTAAKARYEAAALTYRGQVRQAVAEVEQALTQLANTSERRTDAQNAADGYRRSLAATQALWTGGLASQLDLENARRTALASELALVTLEQERMNAWIQLYRAAGGGWDANVVDPQGRQPGTARSPASAASAVSAP
ncbi:efflux transporter outer membrane subunit [Diaphorobacter aerolatus]|uniref:Efflux transporter outer membrane subunit n=1 Tax=Diaphorobacter aerolatus TaxID=1288495 RepID=A0A7H0GGT2_9BURK|nr:efflux transporter outer membrane subunit [Diaphorobacter aerolatus]QNP47498.1 efflux transporter outer membrane subunit [Diaphorobacter aerolatus]